MMHENSLATYAMTYDDLSDRACKVYLELTYEGESTAREIRDKMFPGEDMNMVRPRLTELKKNGFIVEVGTKMEGKRPNAIFRALTTAERSIERARIQEGRLF